MRSRDAVEKGLLSKGFRQNNSHHRFFVYYTLAGVKSRIKTKTSHAARDIDRYLISQMAKQCGGLAFNEFLQLVDCPLTQAAFEKRVKDRL